MTIKRLLSINGFLYIRIEENHSNVITSTELLGRVKKSITISKNVNSSIRRTGKTTFKKKNNKLGQPGDQ